MKEVIKMDESKETNFKEYFSDIEKEYDDALRKAKKYAEIMDSKIDELSKLDFSVRGSQHHLTEHMTNAVSLLGRVESLIDKKFKLKETVLDYETKANKDVDTQAENVAAEIMKMVKESKKQESQVPVYIQDEQDIDDEIQQILNAGN